MINLHSFSVQQVRKKQNIDPANVTVNDNIRAIKAEWACNKPGCQSDACWISVESEAHIPLGYSHLKVWAAAMVRITVYFMTFPSPQPFRLFVLKAYVIGTR